MLRDARIVVTGAAGRVGFPISRRLEKTVSLIVFAIWRTAASNRPTDRPMEIHFRLLSPLNRGSSTCRESWTDSTPGSPDTADETVEMTAGDTITMPLRVIHNAVNLGDTPAVLAIAFSSEARKVIEIDEVIGVQAD